VYVQTTMTHYVTLIVIKFTKIYIQFEEYVLSF